MSGYRELTRNKTHSTPAKIGGVYRGVISRIDANGRLIVQIPRISSTLEYGPLDFVVSTSDYIVGDKVAIESIEDYPDAYIVIGKIGP